MRIDAHQHFWRYAPETHGWITDEMAVLRRDYGPEDLAGHLRDHRLDGSIAVQAATTELENAYLLDLAGAAPSILGVVGWVDLTDEEAERSLVRFAEHPRAVGIRHIVQDEPDDRFLDRPDFRRGVGHLAALGLVYDVLVYERQLPAALEFVRAFPEQPMVLDHLAKPRIAAGEFEPWASRIREIARCENLTAKVSGLVTEADWANWTPADLRPYLDTALEAFGPGRLMFGSDWPVCRLAGEYDAVRSALDEWLATLGASERAAIEGGTAARVYGLA